MSFDLYQRETVERVNQLTPSAEPDIGVWDGFARGAGMHTVRTLTKGVSGLGVLGSVVPIAYDAITGGTEAQEKYFKEHDEMFGKAVDFWTPKSHEVGAAGEVVGTLLGTLPVVVASPSLAVTMTQSSVAEDMVKQGIDADTANIVGAVQGVGLGLGIYVPILGKTLPQRILLGGAGFNAAQGVAVRGISGELLEGTAAEGQFSAFDPTQLTLDVLLGAAFGGIAHLSPAARTQGAEFWGKLESWGKDLKPSDIDALAVLRQAQHLNADSMPGKPAEPIDVERHVQRTRKAIEQAARDEPIEVSDLPQPKFKADDPRLQEMASNAQTLSKIADDIRQAEGLPAVPESEAPAAMRGATEPPPRGERVAEAAGAEVIPRASALSEVERAIETKFADYVVENTDQVIKRYQKKFGNVINTDNARELSDDYAKTKESRSRLAAAVHEPASWIAKEMYRRELAKPAPEGKYNLVAFTSGGTGAGKTTAIEAVGGLDKAQIVYDTNMNGIASAVGKIEQALAAGKQVSITHVHRDPVDALINGALKRAMRMGRAVPLAAHIETHVGSAKTIQELATRYKDNPNVSIKIIDNTGGKGGAKLGDIDTIARTDYNEIESKLLDALNKEYKSGQISKAVYQGTIGSGAEEILRRSGETDGRQPESPGARRGSGEEGKENRVDPLQLEAERFVSENPDVLLTVGTNADGTPILRTAKEYLDEARQASENARRDIGLFEVAAQCMLGRAA